MSFRTPILATAALLLATAASAQDAASQDTGPGSRSVTIDNARVSGTRTVTTNPEAGTIDRATELTRKSDGATASGSSSYARSEDGVTRSGTQTGFDGRTRSRDYARTRTETGYTETGSYTGRGGETVTLQGSGTRTDTGYNRNRALTSAAGETLASRNVDAVRAGGQISRNISSVRPVRSQPPVRGRRAR